MAAESEPAMMTPEEVAQEIVAIRAERRRRTPIEELKTS
jgi:hypothetical protein